VELDSTTLADIYAKQGFYAKALAIYRRLLRMAPHNDLIRMKVSELARLDKEQRHEDLESDPIIYERMEVVEIIDRQTRFLNGLLDSLTQKRS
jgi:tetratricopeptide (TPR) repeat protein